MLTPVRSWVLGKPTGRVSECEVQIAGVWESMKTTMIGGPTGGVTIAPTKGVGE